MAIIFIDSCGDHYASNDMGKVWDYSDGSMQVSTSGPRYSGGRYFSSITPGSTVGKYVSSTNDRLIVGVAMYCPGGGSLYVKFAGSTGTQCKVELDNDGAVFKLFRGENTLLTNSVGNMFPTNQWIYVEVDMTVSSTAGGATVRINGLERWNTGYTRNTKGTSDSPPISSVLMGSANTSYGRFDDVYIIDPSLPGAQTFLGDCRVDVMWPNSDVHKDFTTYPASQPHNYTQVDDTTDIDDDATYNYSNTLNAYDEFTFTDLPNLEGETIYALAISHTTRKDNAGSRWVTPFVRINTVQSYGTEVSIGDTYKTFQSIWEKSPDTDEPWTKSELDAMTAGYEITGPTE
jgi:hypothetical protein